MAKVRIYQLAKELGVDNKDIIAKAIELGVAGRAGKVVSHSHSLDPDEAEKIRRAIIRQSVASQESEEKTRIINRDGGEQVVETSRGGVIRRRRRDEGEALPQPVVVAPVEADELTEERGDESFGGTHDEGDSDAIHGQAHADDEEMIDSENQEDGSSVEIDGDVSGQAEISSTSDVLHASGELEANGLDSDVRTTSVAGNGTAREGAQDLPVAAAAPPPSTPTVTPTEPAKPSVGGPRVLGRITLPVRPKKEVKPVLAPKKPRVITAAPIKDDDEGDGKKGKKRKQEFSRGDLLDYDVARGGRKGRPGRGGRDGRGDARPADMAPRGKRTIKVEEFITVGDLAKGMSLKVGDVITKLIELGVMATINQSLDVETATLIAESFGHEVVSVNTEEESLAVEQREEEGMNLSSRPPVVTVMGHVDHGKTSLLDAIRNASVAAKEDGGITQHIGAYQVTLPDGKILTFIDTPGHAAFTEMRSRGAEVTDIVVLVVAADDGVMPQTVEALSHARAAKVPIIVAVNKIDKPGANIDRIKQQLADLGLQPDDWGGDTMFVPVSAIKRDGIPELLERILLQAEVMELKANFDGRVRGSIIESKQDRGRGIVATVLVQHGTLSVGDLFVSGAEYGRIRTMVTFAGEKISAATPSTPVEITGFSGVPLTGDDFMECDSESQAREIAQVRAQKRQVKEQRGVTAAVSLEEFSRRANDLGTPEFTVILKADVQGSVEAVKSSIESLSGEKVRVKVVHAAVGGITESDVQLAIATRSVIVGFCVRAETKVMNVAEASGIELRFYRVIYELTDDLKKAMAGLLDPVKKEAVIGRAEVRETFSVPKLGTVAGCYILDGFVKRGAHLRLVRDSKVIFEGSMSSLRRFKDDVREVQSGFECGIGIESYSDIKTGDIIEAFQIEEIAPTLD